MNKTISFKNWAIITSCVCLLLVCRCSKEEMKVTGNCEFDCQLPAIDTQSFYLTEKSKSFVPYTGFEKLVFVNGNMQEVRFKPSPSNRHQFSGSAASFICKNGNSIDYLVNHEHWICSHYCESLNLEYYLNFLSYPSSTKPLVVDMFKLLLLEPSHDFYLDTSIQLNLITDFRNNEICLHDEYSNFPNADSTGSVELLGRVFNNTYSVIEPANLLKELYYNKEFGIVGFRDIKGVLWRFERFE